MSNKLVMVWADIQGYCDFVGDLKKNIEKIRKTKHVPDISFFQTLQHFHELFYSTLYSSIAYYETGKIFSGVTKVVNDGAMGVFLSLADNTQVQALRRALCSSFWLVKRGIPDLKRKYKNFLKTKSRNRINSSFVKFGFGIGITYGEDIIGLLENKKGPRWSEYGVLGDKVYLAVHIGGKAGGLKERPRVGKYPPILIHTEASKLIRNFGVFNEHDNLYFSESGEIGVKEVSNVSNKNCKMCKTCLFDKSVS